MFQKLTPNTGVHWNAVTLHKSCSIQADLSGLVTRVLFQHDKQRVQQEEVAQQTTSWMKTGQLTSCTA